MDFKIGDRVKYVRGDNESRMGNEGTVIRVFTTSIGVAFDKHDNEITRLFKQKFDRIDSFAKKYIKKHGMYE